MKLNPKSRGLTTSLIDEHGKTVAVVDSDRATEIARAVNSHEAAQRLAEAAKNLLDNPKPLPSNDFGKLQSAAAKHKHALEDMRDALAEWEAVK